MKTLILICTMIFSSIGMSEVYTRTLPSNFDSLDNLVEVAKVSAHELAHTVQQRKLEINLIIENTKDGNFDYANVLWKKLVISLVNEGGDIDISALSYYILQESFTERAPKLFQTAKAYGEAKEQVESLFKSLEVLMKELSGCGQNSRCMAPLKVKIVQTQKEMDKQTARRNSLFLELEKGAQIESQGIDILYNICKTRHEIAANSIRNLKA